MKIEIKLIPDSMNAWSIFAVIVDGNIRYRTGNARSMYDYCKHHFGIRLPINTGWKSFAGLEGRDSSLAFEI